MSDWVSEAGENEVWWWRYRVVLTVSLLGVLLLTWGVILLRWPGGSEARYEMVGAVDNEPTEVVVQVAGAVMRPGVFTLPAGARVNQALVEAGGLAGKADREYVARKLNLAQKLEDGQKIYIPAVGEETAGSVLGVEIGVVGVNSASMRELESLNGIGPKTAAKIVENRPYARLDELVTREVIGKKLYESLEGQIGL